MTEDGSVYKRVELVGASKKSWEDAIGNVVAKASQSIRDLRIAEVDQLDVTIKDGKVVDYRVRVKISFKYEKD
jgi:flavin-binding protein dodecin